MIVRFAALCFFTLITSAAMAQTAGPPWPAEATVPSSRKVQFTSTVNGEEYTLLIKVPLTPPPKGGYPVIYILDGDFYFGTASDISLGLGNTMPVVVAIGHDIFEDMSVVAKYAGRTPGGDKPVGLSDVGQAMNSLRFHDYTLPVTSNHRAPDWTGLTPSNVGGVDAFLQVIEKEIKPKVAAILPIDESNQAIFGHSIAGLAVLRALFTEPKAFRTYIAASPSIWWNADAVLADEGKFADSVRSGAASPRVLLTVGANEPENPNPPQSFINSLPADRADSLAAYVKMASQWSGMVSGARNLAARLGKLPGGAGYEVRFVSFADESHETVPFAALSRGMHFAFPQ